MSSFGIVTCWKCVILWINFLHFESKCCALQIQPFLPALRVLGASCLVSEATDARLFMTSGFQRWWADAFHPWLRINWHKLSSSTSLVSFFMCNYLIHVHLFWDKIHGRYTHNGYILWFMDSVSVKLFGKMWGQGPMASLKFLATFCEHRLSTERFSPRWCKMSLLLNTIWCVQSWLFLDSPLPEKIWRQSNTE